MMFYATDVARDDHLSRFVCSLDTNVLWIVIYLKKKKSIFVSELFSVKKKK